MNFFKLILKLISAFILILVYQNCSQFKLVDEPIIENSNSTLSSNKNITQLQNTTTNSRNQTKKNIKFKNLYFGYFGDAMSGVGSGNYLDKTASRSNIHFIREEPMDYAAWRHKLNLAKQNNNQVILMIQHVVYPWADVLPFSDPAERFKIFFNEISDFKDIIVGYYLFDEPYWNNDLRTNDKRSIEEVYLGLDQSAKAIKSSHPEAKVIVTFAYPEMELSIKIPNTIDWIGLNCYFAYGDHCSENKIIYQLSKLKQLMKPHHKLVLTLDAYNSKLSTQSEQNLMIQRIQFWLKNTQNLPVVAYFPFLYQNQNTENLYGAEAHPIVLSYLDQIFYKIKNSSQLQHKNLVKSLLSQSAVALPSKNSQNSICINKEPICEGKDYVRRDSCGKVIERWSSAPLCPSVSCTVLDPKCEGSDYIRRDSCGKVIEKWAAAPICSSVKCENTDYVRRNSSGVIIEIWKNAPLCSSGSASSQN